MIRAKRIALELLGPPLFGAVVWYLVAVGLVAMRALGGAEIPAHDLNAVAPWNLIGVLMFAYLLAGIPSVIYAAIMEWRFARGLDPKSWRAVGLATALGGASGFAVVAICGGFRGAGLAVLLLASLGLVVGFSLGFLIKFLSVPKEVEEGVLP